MAKAYRSTIKENAAKRWVRYHAEPERWFWNRVDQSGGDDACWPWMGRVLKARGGYGRLKFKGRHLGAHRMSLILSTGVNPEEHQACHHCDNPICCNPRHLFWGTPQQNVEDCVRKGRKRGAARIIDLDVAVQMRGEGATYSEIAAHFSVDQSSVGKALKRAALRAGRQG